jgi:hypothetical protein
MTWSTDGRDSGSRFNRDEMTDLASGDIVMFDGKSYELSLIFL